MYIRILYCAIILCNTALHFWFNRITSWHSLGKSAPRFSEFTRCQNVWFLRRITEGEKPGSIVVYGYIENSVHIYSLSWLLIINVDVDAFYWLARLLHKIMARMLIKLWNVQSCLESKKLRLFPPPPHNLLYLYSVFNYPLTPLRYYFSTFSSFKTLKLIDSPSPSSVPKRGLSS